MAVNRFEFRGKTTDRIPVRVQLDSTTADIEVGTAITTTNATAGYHKEVDATAEVVKGVSMERVSSPSADGGASVLIDVSPMSVYEVPPDTGTVVLADQGKKVDVGADGQSLTRAGSTTADFLITRANVDDNTLYCRFVALESAVGGS
jgi:hypothetical protein